MKKCTLLFTLVFCLGQTVFAATPPFYKIEKNGETGYVLGIMPDSGVDIKEIPQEVADVYFTSQNLILATPPMEAATEEDKKNLEPYLVAEENSLREQLSAEQWEALLLRGLTDNLQQSAELLVVLPSAPVFQVVDFFKKVDRGQTQTPVDVAFINNAVTAKKNILVFESIVQTVESLVKADDIDTLRALLGKNQSELQNIQVSYDNMLAAYRAGDDIALEAAARAFYSPKEYNILITERNAVWAATLDAVFVGEGQDFYLLPAEQLVGEQGLMKALEAQGYKVTRWEYSELATNTPAEEVPTAPEVPVVAPAPPVQEEVVPEVPASAAPVSMDQEVVKAPLRA